jgi:hypothetical protein
MDNIECLVWNGNEPIFAQKYNLIADPKEPKTIQEKIKKAIKIIGYEADYENRIAYGSIIYELPLKQCMLPQLWSVESISSNFGCEAQHIRKITGGGGAYYTYFSEPLEHWLQSQTRYEYSKFLIKYPVVKKYSGWELNWAYQAWFFRIKVSIHMRYIETLSSKYDRKLNERAIFDKKSVQTCNGEVQFGMIYLPHIKIVRNSRTPINEEFRDDDPFSLEVDAWWDFTKPRKDGGSGICYGNGRGEYDSPDYYSDYHDYYFPNDEYDEPNE